jgi:DNA-binding transcriptional MerR regulator
MLDRSDAANQKRKESAFLGELAKQRQPQVDTSMPQSALLQNAALAPEDPSMVPWMTSARNSGLMSNPIQSLYDPPKMYMPNFSMSDVAALGATPRFAMIGPERATAIASPLIEEHKIAQEKAEKEAFFNGLGNAESPQERINAILRGTGMGYLDSSAMGHYVDHTKHYDPQAQFNTVDLGGKKEGYTFTPTPGAPTLEKVMTGDVTMTPYQTGQLEVDKGRNALGWAELKRQYEDMDLKARIAQMTADAGTGADWLPVINENGEQVLINKKTNEIRKTGVKPYQKPQLRQLSDIEKSQLRDLEVSLKTIEKKLDDAGGFPIIEEERAGLLKEKEAILARRDEIYGRSPSQSTDVELSSFGNKPRFGLGWQPNEREKPRATTPLAGPVKANPIAVIAANTSSSPPPTPPDWDKFEPYKVPSSSAPAIPPSLYRPSSVDGLVPQPPTNPFAVDLLTSLGLPGQALPDEFFPQPPIDPFAVDLPTSLGLPGEALPDGEAPRPPTPPMSANAINPFSSNLSDQAYRAAREKGYTDEEIFYRLHTRTYKK